jgi:hypothetical protein
MAETSTGNSNAKRPPDWFVSLCKRLWEKQSFIWTTLVLGITLNVIASLLFVQWPLTASKNLDGTIIGWFIQNPGIILFAGVILLLLFIIIYLGSRFDSVVVIPGNKPPEYIEAEIGM